MGTIQNVFYTVSWADYKAVPKPKPDPGDRKPAAYTLVENAFKWTPAPIAGTSRARLGDINMNIFLVKVPALVPATKDIQFTWVADYVDQLSTFGSELLHHEQGHYDIAAFLYSDLFTDIHDQFIQVAKPKEFANQKELDQTMEQRRAQQRSLIAQVSDLYDKQCGDVGTAPARAAQKKWDGYFASGRVNRFDKVLRQNSIIP